MCVGNGMGRRSLTLPNYIFRCRIMHQIYFNLEESKKCVFNLISWLPTLLARLSLMLGCVWFCVRAFATSQTKLQTPPDLAAVSLNPARSLAAAQVASTGYSILDTLPLSPFTVRNSVAITPSARHSSVSLWPRYEGKFQEMSPETLQVVPDRIWRGICDLEISNATSLFTSYQIKVRQNKYQPMHVW